VKQPIRFAKGDSDGGYVRVAGVNNVQIGAGHVVEIGDRSIAIFSLDAPSLR
jgi:hypothetical protein